MRQSIFTQGSELGWRFPSQCRMKVIESVVHEPLRQWSHDLGRISKVAKRQIGSLKGSNSRLRHTVAFWASHGRLEGHQSNITPKSSRLLVDVTAAYSDQFTQAARLTNRFRGAGKDDATAAVKVGINAASIKQGARREGIPAAHALFIGGKLRVQGLPPDFKIRGEVFDGKGRFFERPAYPENAV